MSETKTCFLSRSIENVLSMDDLKLGEKIICIGIMARLAISGGSGLSISHEALANYCGLSTPTINTSIKSLEKKKIILIERSRNFGVSNIYRIIGVGVN